MPSADPPPEIVTGSRPSGSPGVSIVTTPPGWGLSPAAVVVVVALTLSRLLCNAGAWMIPPAGGAATDDDFFKVVAELDALAAVVTVDAAAVDDVSPVG